MAAAPAGGFFTNRHMHAWGGITLGATLVIGAVPLGRTVSPHATPWWVPPGLVLGAVFLICGVLLFALPGIIGSLSPEYLAPSPASAPEFKDGDTKADRRERRQQRTLPAKVRDVLAEELLAGDERYAAIEDVRPGGVEKYHDDLSYADEWIESLESRVRELLGVQILAEMRIYRRPEKHYFTWLQEHSEPWAYKVIIDCRRYLDWLEDTLEASKPHDADPVRFVFGRRGG
jgi:hypothetical protein